MTRLHVNSLEMPLFPENKMPETVTPQERQAVLALLRQYKGKVVLKDQVEQARVNLKRAGLI